MIFIDWLLIVSCLLSGIFLNQLLSSVFSGLSRLFVAVVLVAFSSGQSAILIFALAVAAFFFHRQAARCLGFFSLFLFGLQLSQWLAVQAVQQSSELNLLHYLGSSNLSVLSGIGTFAVVLTVVTQSSLVPTVVLSMLYLYGLTGFSALCVTVISGLLVQNLNANGLFLLLIGLVSAWSVSYASSILLIVPSVKICLFVGILFVCEQLKNALVHLIVNKMKFSAP